jgi:hypothetical protein
VLEKLVDQHVPLEFRRLSNLLFGRLTDFPSRTAWAIGEIELGHGFTTPAAFAADY